MNIIEEISRENATLWKYLRMLPKKLIHPIVSVRCKHAKSATPLLLFVV
jgi:hypothetical protein